MPRTWSRSSPARSRRNWPLATGPVADRRLDGQIELEDSWRRAAPALTALMHRHIGGKAVLHID
jgi:hypothetical protein